MTIKERAKQKILEFLADPENSFPTRSELSTAVCGYSTSQTIYRLFTPAELGQIEQEAIEIRRTRCVRRLSKIDEALLTEAEQGNIAAMRLAYARFENWSESTLKDKAANTSTFDPLVAAIEAGITARRREK